MICLSFNLEGIDEELANAHLKSTKVKVIQTTSFIHYNDEKANDKNGDKLLINLFKIS